MHHSSTNKDDSEADLACLMKRTGITEQLNEIERWSTFHDVLFGTCMQLTSWNCSWQFFCSDNANQTMMSVQLSVMSSL